jgi:ribonuclease HI
VIKLEELFYMNSVEAILKINIPLTPRPDKIFWTPDPKGKFSVKSAFACNQTSLDVEVSSPHWKALWKLKIHDRLKMLIWRIGAGVLSTNGNFVTKLGFGDSNCPLCCTTTETTIHLFFHCSIARALWFGQDWNFKPEYLPIASCFDIVKLVTEPPLSDAGPEHKKELHTLFAIPVALTLECIWSLRNTMVHKASQPNLEAILKSLEFRYLKHSLVFVGDNNHEAHSPTFWQPLNLGTLKLNTDATVRQHSSTIAVIARDEKGTVCNAWARMVDTVDPDIAEALAIKWAVQFAFEETYTKIIVESDSNKCIESIIGSPEDTYWNIEAICSDVNILALDFISCCLSWVKRDANSAAHELAKFAAHLGTPLSYNASSLPPNVFKAWQRDMLGFPFTEI